MKSRTELSVIQRTHDLIRWYIPILNRMPLDFKLTLGRRVTDGLYDMLESLIKAKYAADKGSKLTTLEQINLKLEIMRRQTQLLHEFDLLNVNRFEHASRAYHDIGIELGAWIKSLRSPKS